MRKYYPFLPAVLVCLTILTGLTLCCGHAQAKKDPFPWLQRRPAREPVYPEILVDSNWLAEHLDDKNLRLIDARPIEDYERGHLPGALHFVLGEQFTGDITGGKPRLLAERLSAMGLSGKESIVLYGNERSYEELGRLFWALEWAGCRKLRVLDGGIAAWTQRGGELSAELPAPESRKFKRSPVDSLLTDALWIAERYGDTELCELVDLRDEGFWARAGAPEGYRPGHLPHSLPYDFSALLPGDGRWPDPPEARKQFGLLGPRARDFVNLDAVFALYGEGPDDPRPGLGYLLLRLMDVRARIYTGGWADWSSREDLPRVRNIPASELRDMIARENPEFADRRPRDFMLFDLRGHRDFRRLHLPGALPLPAHTVIDSLDITCELNWPGFDRAAVPIVLYCYGPDCVRSRIGASRAARAGFHNLLIFRGGIAEWRQAELPGHGKLMEMKDLRRR